MKLYKWQDIRLKNRNKDHIDKLNLEIEKELKILKEKECKDHINDDINKSSKP